MKRSNVPEKVIGAGSVFIVLAAIQLVWFDGAEYAQGALTGGILVVFVGLALWLRRHSGSAGSAD